jgi:pimeloyl-ACP methyl ester carboxylesterase
MTPDTQRTLLAQPVILLLLLGVNISQVKDFGSRLLAQDPLFIARLALVVPDPGESVRLESDVALWILRAPGDNPRGTAILLHGNDRRGSWQPAALALQGAMIRAGYDVLSVDQKGYGATPLPGANADWSAWDPTIVAKQALEYLRSANNARSPATIIVGHSMGANDAVHWLSDGVEVDAAYLFGGSNDPPTGSESQWVKVFHQHRRMKCCIPLEKMRMIRDHFHGGAVQFAATLPPSHAAVHYVRFGLEYDDVTRDREPLYAAISAPKTVCDFAGVTHYFNTLSLRNFALIDTLAIRHTAAIFSSVDGAGGGCSSENSRIVAHQTSSP